MDIQAYISSGVLESYVLGELSASEARQVEELAQLHPEIKQELQLIEETLEGVVSAAAIAPHALLKASILDQIGEPAAPAPAPEPASSSEAKLRSMPSATPRPWLMAASISLAVVSTAAAIYFWSQWQNAREQLSLMTNQQTMLAQQVSTLENRSTGLEQTLAVFTDPDYNTISLQGLAPAPDARALVLWNPLTQEVYLNPGSLPPAPAGKQYQLWAIVDGKPVDAGIFDASGALLRKMGEIKNASAFAVTLEPAGGSVSPTLDQMYVMGEAS